MAQIIPSINIIIKILEDFVSEWTWVWHLSIMVWKSIGRSHLVKKQSQNMLENKIIYHVVVRSVLFFCIKGKTHGIDHLHKGKKRATSFQLKQDCVKERICIGKPQYCSVCYQREKDF